MQPAACAEMMMETENGQKLKLFTHSGGRPECIKAISHRAHTHTQKVTETQNKEKKISNKGEQVSCQCGEMWHRHRAERSTKDEAKWWICKYFFTFFSILFLSHFPQQFAAGAEERWRMSPNDREVEAWCGHLSILEPFVFMENEALFHSRHKFSYSTHLRQWANGQMGNSNTRKENTLHCTGWLAGWLAAGWNDMVKRKCKCRLTHSQVAEWWVRTSVVCMETKNGNVVIIQT